MLKQVLPTERLQWERKKYRKLEYLLVIVMLQTNTNCSKVATIGHIPFIYLVWWLVQIRTVTILYLEIGNIERKWDIKILKH